MSMMKRYLESLPVEEQNAIIGDFAQEEEGYWAAYDADCKTILPPVGPDEYPDYGDLDAPW